MYRRITIVTIPLIIKIVCKSDSLFIGCLLTGCLLNLFLYRIFPCFRNYFSLSEIILYLKWMLILLSLIFSSNTSVTTRVSATIVILSVFLTVIVLLFYSFIPFIQAHPFMVYSFIVAGASIEIRCLSYVTKEPFILWFIKWLFQVQAGLSLRRIGMLIYWAGCLVVAFLFLSNQMIKNQPVIAQRKYFHYLSVVLFLPCTLFDPQFMELEL